MSQIPPSHPQPKSHKIRIPRHAASYTPATMDMELRSELNLQMISKGHDKKIQEHILYTLNSQPTNWPSQVQARALALLRSGEAKTFPQLLKQVLEEVRKETGVLRPTPSGAAAAANGDNHAQTNGNGKKATNGGGAAAIGSSSNNLPGPGEASNLHAAATASLALPQAAVDEAMRVTREVLDELVEIEVEKGNGAA